LRVEKIRVLHAKTSKEKRDAFMVGRVLIRLLLLLPQTFVPSPSFHHLFTDGSLQSMSSAFPFKNSLKKKNRDGKKI
jgi:hypothetical protein